MANISCAGISSQPKSKHPNDRNQPLGLAMSPVSVVDRALSLRPLLHEGCLLNCVQGRRVDCLSDDAAMKTWSSHFRCNS